MGDGQMQLAPAADLEGVGGLGLLHPHGHVGLDLLEEPLPDVAAGHIPAFLAGEGAVVHLEEHAHRGLIDVHEGHGLHAVWIAGGLAHVQIIGAGHADDVAGMDLLHLHPVQALEAIEPGDLGGADLVVFAAAENDALGPAGDSPLDAAHADLAHVIIVVDGGEEDL